MHVIMQLFCLCFFYDFRVGLIFQPWGLLLGIYWIEIAWGFERLQKWLFQLLVIKPVCLFSENKQVLFKQSRLCS